MIQYIVYNSNGRIIRHGMCQQETLELQAMNAGEMSMEGTCNDTTDYVKDLKVLTRPECPATLEGNTLKNVPVPAVVSIDGTDYDTDVSDITLDMPIGKYKIKVIAFPHLDKEFELVV